MQETKGRRHTGCTRIVKVLLAASFLTAAGCAPLPRMDSPPTLKKVDELGSSNSFAAPDAAWPGDGWWRAYGDPQLDVLIDEALQRVPGPAACAGATACRDGGRCRARMPRESLR